MHLNLFLLEASRLVIHCCLSCKVSRVFGIGFCFIFMQLTASAAVDFDAENGKAVQTIEINKGWNSVYLWVQPDDLELDTYLADKPQVTRVATFSQPVSRATMAESDSENFQHNAGWKIWRSGSILSKVNTLKGLLGARGYLFYASSPTELTFTGEFVNYDRYVGWVGDRFNFQSFPVSDDSVSFGSYLSVNSKLDQALVYELNDKAEWALVDPRSMINPEKAYWVYCHNGTNFTGNVVRADRPVTLKRVIDEAGVIVYEAELEFINKIRSPVNFSLSATLPLKAKVVRPGQFFNTGDDPYLSLSAVNLELSDQTSNQANVTLRLPATSVTSQLNHAVEVTTPQGDRKFYSFTIEGNL